MRKNKYDIKEFCTIPPPYGGITAYVKRVVDQLTEDGYIVGGYYTPDNKDPKISGSILFDLIDWDLSAPKICKFYWHAKRILEIMPYKLIHYHGLENMILIWIFYHFCKKKIVITVHSSMIMSFYYRTSSINKFFIKQIASSDAQWIAVSEQAKSEMQKLPFKFNKPISVIPAYIPPTMKFDKPFPGQMLRYIESHNKIITFYGHSFMLHEGKDVYGFNNALKLFKDVLNQTNENIGFVLCLAESKDTEKIDKLHKIANQLNVDDKIYWQIGAIDNFQFLLAKTDVYIRPTFTDGDSIAIHEVLDMGVQVVTSDVCLRPKGAVTYAYGDEVDFARKVLSSLQEKKKQIKPNYIFYNEMKTIYQSMLSDCASIH